MSWLLLIAAYLVLTAEAPQADATAQVALGCTLILAASIAHIGRER